MSTALPEPGTRRHATLAFIAQADGPMSTPEIMEGVACPATTRFEALVRTGNALRNLTRGGYAVQAGSVPTAYNNTPAATWRITSAGRELLARVEREPVRRAEDARMAAAAKARRQADREREQAGREAARQRRLREFTCTRCLQTFPRPKTRGAIPKLCAPCKRPPRYCCSCGAEFTPDGKSGGQQRRCPPCRSERLAARAAIPDAFAAANAARWRAAGERDAEAAAIALRVLGTDCPQAWRQIAELRAARPELSWSELAEAGGFTSKHVVTGHWRRMKAEAARRAGVLAA